MRAVYTVFVVDPEKCRKYTNMNSYIVYSVKTSVRPCQTQDADRIMSLNHNALVVFWGLAAARVDEHGNRAAALPALCMAA